MSFIEDQSRDAPVNQQTPGKSSHGERDSIYAFVQILSDSYFYNFKILINSYNNDDFSCSFTETYVVVIHKKRIETF